MIDNTYDRFMIISAEGRRRTIVEYDEKTFDNDNPLFGRINGATRCGISLHVTPTKKRRKNRDGKQIQYLLQGKCKVFQKKTTRVCSNCVETDAVINEMWVCHPKKIVFVLHSMCISHMTFSAKYFIIKLFIFNF